MSTHEIRRLRHSTQPLKNQRKSSAYLLRNIRDLTCWTGKDPDQTGTEPPKRTNKPKSLSPLLPLRGSKIAAKVIEVVHVAATRVVRVAECAPSLGMENAKKARIVLISTSRIPSQDLVLPKDGKGQGRW